MTEGSAEVAQLKKSKRKKQTLNYFLNELKCYFRSFFYAFSQTIEGQEEYKITVFYLAFIYRLLAVETVTIV